MADDLDWRAIIAPGDDAANAGDARPETAQPLTRREARARRDAEQPAARAEPAAPAEQTGREARVESVPPADDAPSPAPAVPADHSRHPDALHPEVAALLGTGADGNGGDGGDGGGTGRGRGSGGGDGRGGRGRASRPPRPPRRRRSRGALIAGIVIVAVVLAGGGASYAFLQPKIAAVVAKVSGSQQSDDYTGSGTGKVTITIKQGDIGSDVARTLQRSGVVKTSTAFYKLLLQSPSVQFQPGSYSLKKHMSSKAALAVLQDSSNKVQASIVIPEGEVLTDIEASLEQKAGLTTAEVQAAAKDTSSYGLPAGVTSLEGYLFPATYPVNPGWTAKQYFQSMVTTMYQHLDAAGVPVADRAHVVTFASVVQKEAGLAADYPKVARVFQNRLDQNMPLQSDATVAYGTGHTDRVTTTDAERNDASNPYNTYQHTGLPPGPISNPGDLAIDAVQQPAAGSWLYFVTVNLETGETVFSDTYTEHQQAVAQFQAWLRAHPSYQ